MAQCTACSTTLQGSWNMTTCGNAWDRTGRYLGISNGYFLYSEQPNWVYCYCKPCWQKQILALSFLPTSQLNTLQQQNTILQQQLTALQQSPITLQQQNTILQQQLTASQNESTNCKKQLDEISDKYNRLVNTSGIDKLRNLFQQLTPAQTETLHTLTDFGVHKFETRHAEQQLQCSIQFMQSILIQLKSSVDTVIELQKNILAQRKKSKETVFQTLIDGGVSTAVVDASIKPLETEIKAIESGMEGWDTFFIMVLKVDEEISCNARRSNEHMNGTKRA